MHKRTSRYLANAQLTQLAKSGILSYLSSGGQRNTVATGDIASASINRPYEPDGKAEHHHGLTKCRCEHVCPTKRQCAIRSRLRSRQGRQAHCLEVDETIILVMGQATITMSKNGNITIAGAGVVKFDKALAHFGAPSRSTAGTAKALR